MADAAAACCEAKGAAAPPAAGASSAASSAWMADLQRRIQAQLHLPPSSWPALQRWTRLLRRLLGCLARQPLLLSLHPALLLDVLRLLRAGFPVLVEQAQLCVERHPPAPPASRPLAARSSLVLFSSGPAAARWNAPSQVSGSSVLPPCVTPRQLWDAACDAVRLLEHCLLADPGACTPTTSNAPYPASPGQACSGGGSSSGPAASPPMNSLRQACVLPAEAAATFPPADDMQSTAMDICMQLLLGCFSPCFFQFTRTCLHHYTAAGSMQAAMACIPSLRAITLFSTRLAAAASFCLLSSRGRYAAGEDLWTTLLSHFLSWCDIRALNNQLSNPTNAGGSAQRQGAGAGGAHARLQARLQQRRQQQQAEAGERAPAAQVAKQHPEASHALPTEADMQGLARAVAHLATTLNQLYYPLKLGINCDMPTRILHVRAALDLALDGLSAMQQPGVWADPSCGLDLSTAIWTGHPYRDGPGAFITGALELVAGCAAGEAQVALQPEQLAGLAPKVQQLRTALLLLLETLDDELQRWSVLCASGRCSAISPHAIRSALAFWAALTNTTCVAVLGEEQRPDDGPVTVMQRIIHQMRRLTQLLPHLTQHPQRAIWALDLVQLAAYLVAWHMMPRLWICLSLTVELLHLYKYALKLLCDPDVVLQQRDARPPPWRMTSKDLFLTTLHSPLVQCIKLSLTFTTAQAKSSAAILICLAQHAMQWAEQCGSQLEAVAVLVGSQAADGMRVDVQMLGMMMALAALATVEGAASSGPTSMASTAASGAEPAGSVQPRGKPATRASPGGVASAGDMAATSLHPSPVMAPSTGGLSLASLVRSNPVAHHTRALKAWVTQTWVDDLSLGWLEDLHARASAAAAAADIPQPSAAQVQAEVAFMWQALAHDEGGVLT